MEKEEKSSKNLEKAVEDLQNDEFPGPYTWSGESIFEDFFKKFYYHLIILHHMKKFAERWGIP